MSPGEGTLGILGDPGTHTPISGVDGLLPISRVSVFQELLRSLVSLAKTKPI